MKYYEIWSEGYAATGEQGRAFLWGIEPGESFRDACTRYAEKSETFRTYLDLERMTWWGCRLFDKEEQAREEFG